MAKDIDISIQAKVTRAEDGRPAVRISYSALVGGVTVKGTDINLQSISVAPPSYSAIVSCMADTIELFSRSVDEVVEKVKRGQFSSKENEQQDGDVLNLRMRRGFDIEP